MASHIESVLVVEDEGLIRMSVVDEMQDAGLHVYEAANADDALKILECHPDIQVVFTDVDMPGTMNEVQLAQAVRITYPKMKVLIASGYLKVARSAMPDGVLYFPKPYDVMKVIEGMRKIER